VTVYALGELGVRDEEETREELNAISFRTIRALIREMEKKWRGMECNFRTIGALKREMEEEMERNRMQSISERSEHSRQVERKWRGIECNQFQSVGALKREMERKWRGIKCTQFQKDWFTQEREKCGRNGEEPNAINFRAIRALTRRNGEESNEVGKDLFAANVECSSWGS